MLQESEVWAVTVENVTAKTGGIAVPVELSKASVQALCWLYHS